MKAETWIFSAALAILPLIGLLIMIPGSRNLWYAFASSGWPSVPGLVRSSEVAESQSRDSRTGTTSVTHSAKIVFEYQVNGRTYTTETIHFGQTEGSADSSEAELRRLRYPPGGKVTVSYNPKDPSVAAVNAGFHSDVLWLPGAGLAFFLPGVMAMVIYLEATRVLPARGIGWLLFAAIFMLVGAAMLAPGLSSLWRARASEAWPVTSGTILYAKLESSTSVHRDSDDDSYRVSTTYGGRLVYRYEVQGKVYFSNRRRFGQISGSDEEWAAEILQRYPQGQNVPVAYSPADPQLTALETGIAGEAYWLLGAGAAFMLFGLAAFLYLPIRRRRKLAGAQLT